MFASTWQAWSVSLSTLRSRYSLESFYELDCIRLNSLIHSSIRCFYYGREETSNWYRKSKHLCLSYFKAVRSEQARINMLIVLFQYDVTLQADKSNSHGSFNKQHSKCASITRATLFATRIKDLQTQQTTSTYLRIDLYISSSWASTLITMLTSSTTIVTTTKITIKGSLGVSCRHRCRFNSR